MFNKISDDGERASYAADMEEVQFTNEADAGVTPATWRRALTSTGIIMKGRVSPDFERVTGTLPHTVREHDTFIRTIGNGLMDTAKAGGMFCFGEYPDGTAREEQMAIDLWRAGLLRQPFDDVVYAYHAPIDESIPAPRGNVINMLIQSKMESDGSGRLTLGSLGYPTMRGVTSTELATSITAVVQCYHDAEPCILWAMDAAPDDILQDIVDETTKTYVYLSYLLATNLCPVRLEKTPEKLNRARQRRGKAPLPDYHVVNVQEYFTLLRTTERLESEDHGSTHRSPITHLRRGHIRTLNNGVKIWVRPCIVNPGGAMGRQGYVADLRPRTLH